MEATFTERHGVEVLPAADPAAGTVSLVADAAKVERDGWVIDTDADGAYGDGVEYGYPFNGLSLAEQVSRDLAYYGLSGEQKSHAPQAVTLPAESAYTRAALHKGAFSQYEESDREKAKYAESVRLARLRLWQAQRP